MTPATVAKVLCDRPWHCDRLLRFLSVQSHRWAAITLAVALILIELCAAAAQPPAANLSVSSITVSPANPTVASNFTYTINISNSGPNSATGVVVTNVLPAGVAFVSGTGPGGAC